MWFGDNVTCATWSDIWINEGFATYSNYLAVEKLHGWNAGQNFIIQTQNNAMGNVSESIYVPVDEIYPGNEWRIFNGQLSYDKGASVIHMLRHEIGNDSLFFDVMGTFQTQYTDSTATGDDFKNVANAVTGTNFDTFFNQWYYGKGYPRFSYVWYYADSVYYLTSTQTSTNQDTPLFDMLMDYKLTFEDGTDTLVQLRQTANLNNFEVVLDKKVINMAVDPDNWTLERVDGILNVRESLENSVFFTIGPNPAQKKTVVYFRNTTTKQRDFRITDLNGKIVLRMRSSEKIVPIRLSGLSKGVYLLTVNDGKNSISKRLVKL